MALVSTTTSFGEYANDATALVAAQKVATTLSGVTTLLADIHAKAFIAEIRAMKLSASQLVEVKLSVAAAGSHSPAYVLSAV